MSTKTKENTDSGVDTVILDYLESLERDPDERGFGALLAFLNMFALPPSPPEGFMERMFALDPWTPETAEELERPHIAHDLLDYRKQNRLWLAGIYGSGKKIGDA